MRGHFFENKKQQMNADLHDSQAATECFIWKRVSRPVILLDKGPWKKCFSVNFAKFFKSPCFLLF